MVLVEDTSFNMILFHEELLFVPSGMKFAHASSSFIGYMMPIVTKQSNLISYCSHARPVHFSYLEIRTVLVRSSRFTTRMVTNEKQKKT